MKAELSSSLRRYREDSRLWYRNARFCLHIDHHPRPGSTDYSGTVKYRSRIKNLIQEVNPDYVQVGSKGHPGWTCFPTQTGAEAPGLKVDLIRFWRELTRELGLPLFIHYSGLNDERAAYFHPEWKRINVDGKPYPAEPGMCAICPTSGYVEEVMLVHLKELIRNYDADGFWVDGDWEGPCFCGRCQKAYIKKYGQAPAMTLAEPQHFAYRAFCAACFDAYCKKCADLIHGLKPSCLYTSNYAYHLSMRPPPAHIDFLSCDIAVPSKRRYHQSIHARRLIATGKPFDIMIADKAYVAGRPYRAKMVPRLLQEAAAILANGAKVSVWTNLKQGEIVYPARLKACAQVADFVRQQAGLCLNSEAVPYAAVLETAYGCHGAAAPAAKMLIELHYDPQIINEAELLKKNSAYKLLVVPEQPFLSKKTCGVIERMAKNGALIIFTGSSAAVPAVVKLASIKILRPAAADKGILRINEQPVEFLCPWDEIKPVKAEVLEYLYKDLREFAPEKTGRPAVTFRKLGRGKVIHIAGDYFWAYTKDNYPLLRHFIKKLLDRFAPPRLFSTDAIATVECVLRKKGNDILLHLANTTVADDLVASSLEGNYYYYDTVPAIGPIQVEIFSPKKPHSVTLEPGNEPADWTWRNGRVIVKIPAVAYHRCVQLHGALSL